MRKSILCTVLLCVLASVLFAAPALAKDYYKMTAVSVNKTEYAITGDYAATQSLSGVPINFTVSLMYRSADSLPSGYNDGTTITWTVTVDPASASTDVVKVGTNNTTTLTAAAVNAGTVSASLTGSLNRDATITVRATHAKSSEGTTTTQPGRALKIKITVPEKPDPNVTEATDTATKLLAVTGAAVKLKTDAGGFTKSNGTIALASGNEVTALNFENYPEYMSITPTPKYLYDTYGITLTDKADGTEVSIKKATNPNITADISNLNAYDFNDLGDGTSKLTTDAKLRVLTFAGTAKAKQAQSVDITIKAWNKKTDGTAGDKTEKDLTLTIRASNYPTTFNTKPNITAIGTTGTIGEKAKGKLDLGTMATTAKTDKREVPEKNIDNTTHALFKLQMVKVGAAFNQSTIKWAASNVTTPAVIYATGLPDGLTLAQEGTTATNENVKTSVTGHLEGSPTKAGFYDSIKIILSNDEGVISQDYVMDVVNPGLEITTEELPDMTWNKAYSATVEASSSDNAYHPTVYFIDSEVTVGTKKIKNSPGLTLNRNTGALSGTLSSTDVALKQVKLDAFVLSADAEKTVSICVAVSNDWTHAASAAADKKVTEYIPFTLKSVAPVLHNVTAVSIQNKINTAGLTVLDDDDDSLKDLISVKGPGKITFEATGFPEGITLDAPSEDVTNAIITVSILSHPTMTAKNKTASIKIYNGANASKPLTIPLKISVLGDASQFVPTWSNADSEEPGLAPVKIGEEVDPVYVEVPFGPVKWTAKDLPSGLKLSIDKSVSNDARVWIVGTPKTSTKIDKKTGMSVYTITATDSQAPAELKATISQDYVVYPKPKITTASLPAIVLDKEYTGKIAGSGATADKMYWGLRIEEYSEGTQARPASRKVISTDSEYNTESFDVANDTLAPKKYLIVSEDAKTGMPIITGSLDRMPESGRLKVFVRLTVAKGTAAEDTVSNDEKPFIVMVRGTSAKIGNPKIGQFSRTDTKVSYDVTATGTLPITMRAYIYSSDVGKFLNLYGFGDIDLSETDTDKNPTGILFSYDVTALDGKAKLVSTGTGTYSFKNLPVHVEAQNKANYNSKTGLAEAAKSADRTLKLTMPGVLPVWKNGDEKVSPDMTVFVDDGKAITNIVYTVSADLPRTITVTPASRNGLSAVVDDDAGTVTISGTPTTGKETKTQFVITALNTATKEKSQVKLTVFAEQRPSVTTRIDSEGYVADKVIEIGKSLNYKLGAKGSKKSYSKLTDAHESEVETKYIAYSPITWEISDEDQGESIAKLVAIGLSFDRKSGTFKGYATGATSNDNGAYKPLEFTVAPVNTTSTSADSAASAKVKIGVKGKKFKIMTKSITLYRDSDDQYDLDACKLATNLTNDSTAKITWAWADSTAAATASTWGFPATIATSGNLGSVKPTSALPTATKGVSIKVSADNIGQTATATVKFVIKDADPEIDGDNQVTMDSAEDSIQQTTREYTIKEAAKQMTGDTQMDWKIAKIPSNNKVKVALKKNADGKGCVVTITAARKISPDIHTSFEISVTNKSTRAIGKYTVSVDVNPYTASDTSALPADKDAKKDEEAELTKDTEETISGDELPTGEGTVTYGESRGESTLTESERTALSEGGYIIAAILPEITTDESGQYDLDAVSLDEAAPEGYELAWFAFPRGVESADIDNIAEFYDEAGAEVFAVPEGRKVVPSPWLEKEVTYAPVIAVKAPSTADAKTSFDQAEEGDTVTVQALEEAAQTTDSEAEPEVISEEAKHEDTAESEAPAEE